MSPATLVDTNPEQTPIALWSSAVLAGVLAGLAWFLWQILGTWWAFGEPPWATVRLIASIALGEDVSRLPLMFSPGVVVTAAALHLGLSILYACLLARLLSRLEMAYALTAGVIYGVGIYVINLYGLAPALMPWVEGLRSWVSFLGHVIFGVVLAFSYKTMQIASEKSLRHKVRD